MRSPASLYWVLCGLHTRKWDRRSWGGAKLHSWGASSATVMGEIPLHPPPHGQKYICQGKASSHHRNDPWHTFSASGFPTCSRDALIYVVLTGATISLSAQKRYLLSSSAREARSKPQIDWLLDQLSPCLEGLETDAKIRDFLFFFLKTLSDKFRILFYILFPEYDKCS